MSKILRTLAAAALPLAALVATPAVHAQVEDVAHVATSCTPASLNALRGVQFNTAGGFIRANNPDSGVVRYTCNLLDSFAGIVPLWNRLGLQYRDAMGGRVAVTLFSKNKAAGFTVAVASVASPASAAVNNVNVPIPALNFAVNDYYVVLSIASSAIQPPEAHMVRLDQ